MSDVLPFTGTTTLDLSVDKVIEAVRGEDSVIIISFKDDVMNIAGSSSDIYEAIVHLEQAKLRLLSILNGR